MNALWIKGMVPPKFLRVAFVHQFSSNWSDHMEKLLCALHEPSLFKFPWSIQRASFAYLCWILQAMTSQSYILPIPSFSESCDPKRPLSKWIMLVSALFSSLFPLILCFIVPFMCRVLWSMKLLFKRSVFCLCNNLINFSIFFGYFLPFCSKSESSHIYLFACSPVGREVCEWCYFKGNLKIPVLSWPILVATACKVYLLIVL